MAFIETPNTALVEMIYSQGGQVSENTLYFEKASGDFSLQDLEDLASAMAAWFTNEMASLISNAVALQTVRVTGQTSVTAPMYQLAVTSGGAGTYNSGPVPNNVSWAVQFTTALRGRSYRGRNYIIGLPTAVVTANLVEATWANLVIDAYEALPTTLGIEGIQHVVVSKYTNGGPRVSGVTTPVLGYRYADLVVDSQRRRLPGRGQ